MSVELALRLLASGAVGRFELESALLAHVTEQVPFVQALLEVGALDAATLERELARGDEPFVQAISPAAELVARLPSGLCRALLAVPVRRDPQTATVDVAVVDPADPHPAAELSRHLGGPVRLLRAPRVAIEEALARLEVGERVVPSFRRPTPAYSSALRESEPPIPLVRRAASLTPAPLGPSDIVEQVESDGTVTDDLGEPILPLRSVRPAPPLVHAAPPSIFQAERPTARGPFAALAPPPLFPDVTTVVASIRAARGRDEIVTLLLAGLRPFARKLAIFAVKRGEYQGFACNAELGDLEALREVRIAHDAPSVLATAVATGTYLGPIPVTPPHAGLLAVMQRATDDVAVVPITVKGRAAMVLVADELVDPTLATRRAGELGRAAGEALTRLLQRTAGR